MTIDEIKQILEKPAVGFTVGGFKPSFDLSESWIGKVDLYGTEESIPFDEQGLPMIPLMQLNLENLPFIPNPLKETKLLTIFISKNLLDSTDIIPSGSHWVIREYKDLKTLEKKELSSSSSQLKPFPLKPKLINDDFPIWDDTYSFPDDLQDEILNLENKEIIESYYDISNINYEHKLGGYPTYCQSGVHFGDGFEFVLQIMSDEKVGFSVGDSGILYLAKNKETDEWVLYWDCY